MTASSADNRVPKDLTRYLTLRFSALLFLFLVLSGATYLAVSAAVTAKEHESVIMNLAGRQRMLIQKYARHIDQILVALAGSDREFVIERKEAASRTTELFEATLAALLEGGEVDAGEQGRIWIPPVRGNELVQHLGHVSAAWEELQTTAMHAIESAGSPQARNDNVREIEAQTINTITDMSHVTFLMQEQSEVRLRRVASSMASACFLGVVLFVGTVVFVRRNIVVPLADSMSALNNEIAERKQVEATLRLTQLAVDQASDAIYWVREDGRIAYVNRSACEQLGYSPAELASMSVSEIEPDSRQGDWPAHWDEMKRAGAITFETHHQTKDGNLFPVEITTNHLVYQGEEYIWAYARDITKRKQAENELRKLSVAIEQSPATVLITDINGTIEYVNPRFTEVTGYTKEEAIGHNPRILKSGKWPKKAYERLWKTILAGKTWRGEFHNRKKNGDLYWESASISPVRNAKGEVTHFLAVKEDITARKLASEELVRSNSVRGEQARAMGILFDLSRSLAGADGLNAIVAHTATYTAELLNSRRVSVMLPDDSGQNLFVAGSIGIDDQLAANIVVPVGSAIAGKVFSSGEPTVLNLPSKAIGSGDRYESEFFASVPLASKALAVPHKVVGVLNVTERHDRRPFEPHEIEYLDLVCNMSASAIEQFQSGQARERAHAAIVIGLAKLAEHRDTDTGKHLGRVTQFALLLARELRKSSQYAATIDGRFLEHLQQSMPLHDIGKVSVPDAILYKPGRLTDAEFSVIRRHTEVGADAIQSVIEQSPEADFLVMARDVAQSHHERFDGSGYPQGLVGNDIPLAARIAAVADVYDALTTKRTYKEAFSHDKAVGIIRDSSGSHFDPGVVDVFLRVECGFTKLAQELQDECDDAHDEGATRDPILCSIAAASPAP